MGFQCGIVGLPNVGKSTLFNALTQAGIEAANYPFCTIEPNTGVVPMPDPRLDQITAIARSAKKVPTSMRFVDIAGLVAGASQGEGLGNQFLAHIRDTQAIAHVVRCFRDSNVTHVSGDVNPLNDITVIHMELALADLQTVERALLKLAKDLKRGDKDAKAQASLLERVKTHLNQGNAVRQLPLTEEEKQFLATYQLLTAKPLLYIANVDEAGMANGNDLLTQVIELAQHEQAQVVPICAALEAEIATLAADEQQEFLQSLGLTEPGLNRVIRAGYDLLGLQTYFTAGPQESRAWTIPQGATAVEAAGVIHTDFSKGFIRAEVIGFADYINYRGEIGAKEAGKWRLEGKDYRVADGDILLFRFNV